MLRSFKYIWLLGLLGTAAIVVGVVVLAISPLQSEAEGDPWAHVPVRLEPTDHTDLMPGPYETGPEVTAACLTCHEDAAHQVAMTNHWTWQSPPVEVAWRDEPVSTGKANVINNFCIGIQSNQTECSRCHVGYGWEDDSFDFTDVSNVDCLVCHDQTGLYIKGEAGEPVETVDLALVAQSVSTPTRANCGGCHFNGGSGNNVKHGDLDSSIYYPSENLDVHMGGQDFYCIDCHQTDDHVISGRSISVSVDNANQIYCTDCHQATLHADERITAHVDSVACQSCHITSVAQRDPTRILWDWSQAGDPTREENPYEYLRTRGEFIYTLDYVPTYAWYSGTAERYLLGDPIDPSIPTVLNQPIGSIDDPNAVIFPFKIHYGVQPYDTEFNILLQPHTAGEEGFFTTFDWPSALEIGAAEAGIPFSGRYDFAETRMYWPLTHMIQPAEYALTCTDCHSDNGRMDWQALGYYGDPMVWGGRGETAR